MAKQRNLLLFTRIEQKTCEMENSQLMRVQKSKIAKMKFRFPYTILSIVCNSKTFVQYNVDLQG